MLAPWISAKFKTNLKILYGSFTKVYKGTLFGIIMCKKEGTVAGILSIQFEPVLNKIDENLEKVKNIIENFISKNSEKPLDLIVLPEFFTTGVSNKYVDFPNPEDGGKPVKFLAELTKKYNTNIIAGTVITKRGENLYNTMFVLNREGKTAAKYDKIHLFKYFGGTENLKVTPGENQPVVVDLDFAKIGLAICFDIKYPLHYKKLAQKGAEIIVNPAAWAYLKSIKGQKEQNMRVFRALNIARATENLVYFVSSNESGNADPLGNIGHSMIVSPMADILAEGKEGNEAIYADIDLELVRTLKTTTPVAFEE